MLGARKVVTEKQSPEDTGMPCMWLVHPLHTTDCPTSSTKARGSGISNTTQLGEGPGPHHSYAATPTVSPYYLDHPILLLRKLRHKVS